MIPQEVERVRGCRRGGRCLHSGAGPLRGRHYAPEPVHFV